LEIFPKIAKFGPKFRVRDFVYSIVLRRFRPSAFRSKSSHRLAPPSTCVDNAFWAVRRGRYTNDKTTKYYTLETYVNTVVPFVLGSIYLTAVTQ